MPERIQLKRIQLKRTKGWRMPPNTVKVDRSTKWGNPFRIGDPGVPDVDTATQKFREGLNKYGLSEVMDSYPYCFEIREQLAGKNLACWCRHGTPCHADVLLEIANS